MQYTIENDGLGYATAINSNFAVVGNPSFTNGTGSIEIYYKESNVFKYNYLKTLNLHLEDLPIYLTAESDFPDSASLATENSYVLEVDTNSGSYSYKTNTFGQSLDLSNNLLVVGNLNTSFTDALTSNNNIIYESASVKIYDLSNTSSNFPIYTIYPDEQFNNLYNYYYTGSLPESYDCAVTQSIANPTVLWNTDTDFWNSSSAIWAIKWESEPVQWMNESIAWSDLTSSLSPTYFTDISFGYSVSINNNLLAIGSPYTCNGRGVVYIYEHIGYDWIFQQVLIGSQTTTGSVDQSSVLNSSASLFGGIVKFDKSSNAILVGTSNYNSTNNNVYLFEYNTTSNLWEELLFFSPKREISNLNYINTLPYSTNLTNPDGFGTAIGIYNNVVVIGAPTDRSIQEYNGAPFTNNGAVYIFNRCSGSNYFELSSKLYGDATTIKDNLFGYSVDVNSEFILVGSPKNNILKSPTYIQNTLDVYNDIVNFENSVNGQSYFVTQNASGSWEIQTYISNKKDYKSPYKDYGSSVYVNGTDFIVGAPILFSTPTRTINSPYDNLQEVRGDFYIYNFLNYQSDYHFGNVFYKNGKIIFSNSESVFNAGLKSQISNEYIYDINFKTEDVVYEKEFMCVVEPNEFNFSTNPTSLLYTSIPLDYYNIGKINFKTIDTLLRYMTYKSTGKITEHWWQNIPFDDIDTTYFNYYINTTFPTIGIPKDFILAEYSVLDTLYSSVLDINDDGEITLDDVSLLWEYFIVNLTNNNYSEFVSPKCSRVTIAALKSYMDALFGKTNSPVINPLFFLNSISSSLNPTGSYLTPYITTIGLYSGVNLVAVAKLGSPIKHNGDFPLNFSVRFDI